MAGETKPYRFLLRMSDELRRRLADSAERSGKSLNREIVDRLEASLSEHVVAEREANGAMAARPRRPSQIGGVMTGRRRHGLAALAVALVAAIAAIAGLALSGSSASEAVAGDPEFPTALSQHLRSIPGNGGEPNEGPGSYEEQQFAALAYPAADIPQAALAGAKSAAKEKKGKFGKGKGKKGEWVSVGPTEALYPFTELRNSFSYVPNTYVAGGRTTVLAIAPTCKPGQCRLWAAAAGGGIWTTKHALNGQPSWDFVSGSFGIKAVGSITVDPNDPSGDTAWVGTGEAKLRRRLRRPASASTSRRTAARRGQARSAQASFNSRAVGTIAVKPGEPEHDLRGVDARCSRRRIRLRGRRLDHSGRTPVGPLQVDRRRCVVDVHPQRRPDPRRVHRRHDRGDERHAVLAARRPSASSSIRSTPTSSTRARTPAASGGPPTPVLRGRRSSRAR